MILLAGLLLAGNDSLKVKIDARVAQVPGAIVGISLRDLQTGDSLDINADDLFHAASTMKVPVMIELFRQTERGALRMDQKILLANEFKSIVDGSPFSVDAKDDSDSLVYTWIGQRVPIHDLLEHMIDRSSNLATNALIQLIDAKRANETAHMLGAKNIRVLRGVEDGKAFQAGMNNQTTSRDLAALLVAIETNKAASKKSCDEMRQILLRQEFNDEIPAGLPAGTPVAHKTGSITAVRHDAAIVYPPNRKPYVLVILTRGIPDDKVASGMMADISRLVWQSIMD